MALWWRALRFRSMAIRGESLHDLTMDNVRRMPCIGDRVRIAGFLGRFEIIRIGVDGTCDLKHLDSPGPDYIEKQVLPRELVYLNPSQPTGEGPD